MKEIAQDHLKMAPELDVCHRASSHRPLTSGLTPSSGILLMGGPGLLPILVAGATCTISIVDDQH